MQSMSEGPASTEVLSKFTSAVSLWMAWPSRRTVKKEWAVIEEREVKVTVGSMTEIGRGWE